MRIQRLLGLLGLTSALLVPVTAFAQTTELPAVQFSWGAIHRGPGQALAINFVVPDAPESGATTSVAATLRITGADGSVLYETRMDGVSGQALSFVIASDDRTAMKTIPGDVYAIIDPNNRFIQARILVAPLSDRALSPERIVATMEVIEISSGRVIAFANNPRVIVPDAPE
jgi:hypothetical protein